MVWQIEADFRLGNILVHRTQPKKKCRNPITVNMAKLYKVQISPDSYPTYSTTHRQGYKNSGRRSVMSATRHGALNSISSSPWQQCSYTSLFKNHHQSIDSREFLFASSIWHDVVGAFQVTRAFRTIQLTPSCSYSLAGKYWFSKAAKDNHKCSDGKHMRAVSTVAAGRLENLAKS